MGAKVQPRAGAEVRGPPLFGLKVGVADQGAAVAVELIKLGGTRAPPRAHHRMKPRQHGDAELDKASRQDAEWLGWSHERCRCG